MLLLCAVSSIIPCGQVLFAKKKELLISETAPVFLVYVKYSDNKFVTERAFVWAGGYHINTLKHNNIYLQFLISIFHFFNLSSLQNSFLPKYSNS